MAARPASAPVRLGSWAVRLVRPAAGSLSPRLLAWTRQLALLGVTWPEFLVHDLGVILTEGERATIVESPPALAMSEDTRRLLQEYQRLLRELMATWPAQRAAELQLSDEFVGLVLAHLSKRLRATETPNGAPEGTEPHALEQLRGFVDQGLLVQTVFDTLDRGVLGVAATLGSSGWDALERVDWLLCLERAEAHDVADFSLQLLPTVLEAKGRASATVHSAFGYAGLSRSGSFDDLLPSELVWDDQELLRRWTERELLFYAHEQSQERAERRQYLLVDASASMRGDRATFARALALASAKKLLGSGERVSLGFFDSRLYDLHHASARRLPVAHVLGFRSERGRNPGRVLRELESVLRLAAQRESHDRIVTLYTHAGFRAPRELVSSVTRWARLVMVFVRPSSGALDLDYLDLLDRHFVIDAATLSDQVRRSEAAQTILATA